jgi:hypothetical protein
MSTKPEKLWGARFWIKRYELIPLVACVSLACGMGITYSLYSLYQKPDVMLTKKNRITPPWEEVDPEKKQKLLTINMQYQKIPELDALRKEIGSYKSS